MALFTAAIRRGSVCNPRGTQGIQAVQGIDPVLYNQPHTSTVQQSTNVVLCAAVVRGRFCSLTKELDFVA